MAWPLQGREHAGQDCLTNTAATFNPASTLGAKHWLAFEPHDPRAHLSMLPMAKSASLFIFPPAFLLQVALPNNPPNLEGSSSSSKSFPHFTCCHLRIP